MSSKARDNTARVKRLARTAAVLNTEIAEQPFLPDEVKATLNGTIDYLNKVSAALTSAETVSA